MANHKRKRPKNRRSGCLCCKPHKANGVNEEKHSIKKKIIKDDLDPTFISLDSGPEPKINYCELDSLLSEWGLQAVSFDTITPYSHLEPQSWVLILNVVDFGKFDLPNIVLSDILCENNVIDRRLHLDKIESSFFNNIEIIASTTAGTKENAIKGSTTQELKIFFVKADNERDC